MKCRQGGFSLLEISVALVVSAIVGVMVWKLFGASRPVAEGDPVGRALIEAQQALEGFAQANYRLPCPAVAPGGAAAASCAGPASGWFPAESLGISHTTPLRYAVSGPLTLVADRYVPRLPPTGSSARINGLDLCLGLQGAAGVTAGGMPVAFAVAHAGANGVFDGVNAGTSLAFDMPGKAHSAENDDRVFASGVGEMFARLGCASRLGEVNGTARAAFAAYDMDRLASMYVRFRAFAVKVNDTNLKIAEAGVALAAVGLAVAIGTEASGIAFAAETGGVAAPQVVIATLNIGYATAGVALAATALQDSIDSAAEAREQSAEAVAFQLLTQQRAADTLAAGIAQDGRGLLP
ncbi:prepilin-type N-terminal cleavage/methylation domain-containing protein [Uliginosibacterium sp. 31-16]|uniref:type II secretion system protein n=1 Tax=Uliginosibacterium sp. 31-16 TaxID=3068315 RepID=UPI00273CFEEF|nr:prepilin-type N-terminal cleavage/methylation domain-containing protein [Uliginosibacterium sp. 31-16]MDP5238565.1 prepilin-type N-terminal cleavage/methylation domain-containing protein [Uliginosibacterium sp. 31-16]